MLTFPFRVPSLDNLMTILGRYFQIRDDYMNIVSDEVSKLKSHGMSGANMDIPAVLRAERVLRRP